MTHVEREERKVLRLAKQWLKDLDRATHVYVDLDFLRAVEELCAAEKLSRKQRKTELKKYPLIYCVGCKRRHRSNFEHTIRRKRSR